MAQKTPTSSIARPSKIYTKLDIPSGNKSVLGIMGHCYYHPLPQFDFSAPKIVVFLDGKNVQRHEYPNVL
jgi:hypothetical protein